MGGRQEKNYISLAMICKLAQENLDELDKCLSNVLQSKIINDVVIVFNGPKKNEVLYKAARDLAAKHGAFCEWMKWEDNFSKARNRSFELAKNDWVFWVDTDDTIDRPELLEVVFNEAMALSANKRKDLPFGVIYLDYLYRHDGHGNPIEILPRERIVNKNYFKWIRPVHEVCEQNRPLYSHEVKYHPEGLFIRHNTSNEKMGNAGLRNYDIIGEWYKKSGDLVALWYLADMELTFGKFEDSISLFQEFITKSQFDEHRYRATCKIAFCCRILKRYSEAVKWDMAALNIKCDWPDAYYGLGESFYSLKKYKDALHWIQVGMKQETPKQTVLGYNPYDYEVRPFYWMSRTYMECGLIKESKECLETLLKIRPFDDEIKEEIAACDKILQIEDINEAYFKVAYGLKDNEEKTKLLLGAADYHVQRHPYYVALYHKAYPKIEVEGDKKRIGIYCGYTAERWSPDSMKSGIGGSEEAVIHMSRWWAKMGYEVFVYSHIPTGKEGKYDGVNYRQFFSYHKKQPHDVMVWWRGIDYVQDIGSTSPRQYLWCHDITLPSHLLYTPETVEKLNKIIVLSEWHKNELQYHFDDKKMEFDKSKKINDVPEEKIWVSKNGIDISALPSVEETLASERLPVAIYTSSYDRGLEYLLLCWPEIYKRTEGKMRLKVCYGWTNAFMIKAGEDERLAEWKDKMDKLLKQPGVEHLGRIGHDQVIQELLTARIWTHPTGGIFPEIFCISAIKAQAMGCFPIVSKYAALKETVQYGFRLEGDVRTDVVQDHFVGHFEIKHLLPKHSFMEEAVNWARDNYSWETVAKEWIEEFGI